jgi:hypothetical protein
VSERRRDDRPDAAVDQVAPQDLSVPMWVWTLIGFALVVAIIIIAIIWGGGQRGPTDQGTGEQPPETTMPAEMPTTAAATQAR